MQQKLFDIEPTGADADGTIDTGVEERESQIEPPKENLEKTKAFFNNDSRIHDLLAAGYKFGSTTVFRSEGQYFFVGDISHCGYKAIQHNAKLIRNEMMKRNSNYGHMNYNDLPTFDKSFDKKHFDSDNQIYKHDIYTWDIMDAPTVFKLFGNVEVGEEYYKEKAEC